MKQDQDWQVRRRCTQMEALAHQIPTRPRPRLLYYTTRVTEAEVHQRFCDLRLHGEWFKKTPELLEYIGDLKEKDKIEELNGRKKENNKKIELN